MKTRLLLIMAVLCSFMLYAQDNYFEGKQLKFVDPVFKGWSGNPDSVTVRIMPGPPAFSSADSAAIKQAIDKWNGTNSHPKLKLISSGTPQISVTRNDNLDGASGTTKANPNWETYESCEVKIDTDDGQPVLGIALHELGHCLGLNDTENKNDVMYGGADSCPTTFSKYDSTEVKDAAAVTVADKGIRDSETPDRAIIPGETAVLQFPVGDIIPDSLFGMAECVVNSIDPEVFVEFFHLDPVTQSLQVMVFVEPDHVNGQFYLFCSIMLPDQRILHNFLGTHCVNLVPVPPVAFDCPMDIYELDGKVHVDWVAGCTYPFGDLLRSRLLVEGESVSYGLQIKPDGDYILDLEPGEYTFTLKVNDFQINTATSSQTVIITGVDEGIQADPFTLAPNPFSDKCTISLDQPGRISIYNMNGILLCDITGNEYTWQPGEVFPPGVYLVKLDLNKRIYLKKIVYSK